MFTTCGTNVRRKKTMKSMFKNTPERERFSQKPRNGWYDDIGNDPKKTGVRGSRKIATYGDA
jgi:hypothetical protein